MANKRDDVLAALRAEEVANHLGIKGPWRGRWMRSRRCGRTDHASDAFGLARDGMWHCHSCDEGGDLLKLIAISEGLDVRNDFAAVLELAAGIAGLVAEDDFGGGPPPPRERPAPPPVEPIAKRLETARKRAAWAWDRLRHRRDNGSLGPSSDRYLVRERGLSVVELERREEWRDTPIAISREEVARLGGQSGEDLATFARMFAQPGIALPVRSPIDGALVDIRVRRFEPGTKSDGTARAKIVGMLGGVTSAPAADGKGRELLGCYGHPHALEAPVVVVVEGLIDYLTALQVWPLADVLGAVEAGSLSLVARIGAAAAAQHGDEGRLLIIEHADDQRVDRRTGEVRLGAAAASIWEEPNAATKVAASILGPRRVGWVFCGGAPGVKDLNDMVRANVPVDVRWWAELFPEAA